MWDAVEVVGLAGLRWSSPTRPRCRAHHWAMAAERHRADRASFSPVSFFCWRFQRMSSCGPA